ncbi:hypothetical protein [Beijerinckia mobilis]|uniref:hypothetical protein n=1 Tax=Beijerinckia mobilis TaxID=231434 RepID=UPI00068EDC3A|nr:hypothetical protein [Beijerinckia mobilis]
MIDTAPTRSVATLNPTVQSEDKLAFLKDARHFPGVVRGVEMHETHMSWVFLTEDRVYKLKKPVRFPYLDFSTLERREIACRAEDTLNRRLAPDVYEGVLPLTIDASGLAIGGSGETVDWLVVMRRLDPATNFETVLLTGQLKIWQVDRVAATLKAFYRHARPVLMPAEHLLADWRRATALNRSVLCDKRFGLPLGPIGRILGLQQRFLSEHGEVLAKRARNGRIIDAHGDLRPEHIWLTRPIRIIDCLEFDARLRALDPLDEIAFLHLECERLGACWAGERIRRRLATLLGEPRSSGLFLFYRTQRALLRARLSIAHLLDERPRTPEKWPRRAHAYIRLAARDAVGLEHFIRKP